MPEKMKIKLVIVEAFSDFPPLSELVYFDNSSHISHWQYSPQGAIKTIETNIDY
jgi:small subunit ribosomal protein S1